MSDLHRELAGLHTERSRPELADLDTRTSRQLVDLIAADDATVPAAVARASAQVAAAVDLVVAGMARGGRLVYAGAGTPGRLGVLDAAECGPTFGTGPEQVTALVAGGEQAITTAAEGAEDDEDAAAADVAQLRLGPDDTLVAITASGRTPYALAAARAARAAGAGTVGVSNNPGGRISELVDVSIEVDTGPEVVAGSTRMKAGTAQKLVLNTLSTATMVRLGKTHGNLMVDVRATNAKLQARARRILQEATGADPVEAERALAEAGGHTKTALVALLAGVDTRTAQERLAAAGGRVRQALEVGS
ncbi:N-acetylmuramic acid 6-phosphate etherase [Ornithinicoccus halotolerans]|uniref:N-acetylmuramic acid 6-phosphate etherase n=1 Tax=Ornithinicoccus halotolerans TaxID=1748220 RepID=UPI0012961506|nr:N-acetylmuramic acid 6-phosphate etherase [Ornithinicoccus halotolerans]